LTRIDRILPWAIAVAFLAAGAAKIVDPLAFAVSIARLRIVPMPLVGPVAILLPWVEVVAAVALLLPNYRLPAIKLLLGLLLVFTAILGIGFLRGTGVSCGCFGSGDLILNQPRFALMRNIALLLGAVWVIRAKPTSPAAPASPA
jgi:hypothetical protein